MGAIESPDYYLAVGVDVDTLVIVAEQQLHPVRVGQRDDRVGGDGTLGVLRDMDIIHTESKGIYMNG